MRKRAEKEMADDNTPGLHSKKLRAYARVKQMAIERNLRRAKEIYSELADGQTLGPAGLHNKPGINELAVPPPGKAKYQHRQRNKTWLPTHVWHAKRAHLETKWGFAVVKTPTAKSYRPTHRASTIAGSVAWDTSYFSTIILESKDVDALKSVILKITKSHVPGSNRYAAATRSWEGLLHDKGTDILGPGLIYWCLRNVENGEPFRVLIRIHPACFSSLYEYLTDLKNGTSGGENIKIYDCRFTIGSIDITGPSSMPSIASVLKLEDSSSPALKSAWKALGSISNSSSLPNNVVIVLNAKDPRFSYPPQPARRARESELVELATVWPDHEFIKTSSLFSPDGVNKSYVNQASQKEVERRKRAAPPGETLQSKESDPSIPIIIFKKNDDSWSMLLPWGWVLPVWHSLLHLNDVHLGGTDQSHQIALESGRLYFPNDYPGTLAGAVAEHEKAEERKKSWVGKPPGKRISYNRLKLIEGQPRGEVGSPFRCDWQFLYENEMKTPFPVKERTILDGKMDDVEMADDKDEQNIAQRSSIDQPTANQNDKTGKQKRKVKHTFAEKKTYTTPIIPCHLSFELANPSSIGAPAIPVKVKYLHRGSPTSAARIYRIPQDTRSQWLKALKAKQTSKQEFPPCPSSDHLIGFITTGAFNLKEGCGFGMGAILANYQADEHCLVRNVGSESVRIAKWERISI